MASFSLFFLELFSPSSSMIWFYIPGSEFESLCVLNKRNALGSEKAPFACFQTSKAVQIFRPPLGSTRRWIPTRYLLHFLWEQKKCPCGYGVGHFLTEASTSKTISVKITSGLAVSLTLLHETVPTNTSLLIIRWWCYRTGPSLVLINTICRSLWTPWLKLLNV